MSVVRCAQCAACFFLLVLCVYVSVLADCASMWFVFVVCSVMCVVLCVVC